MKKYPLLPLSLLDELSKLEEEQFFSEYDVRISNSEIEEAMKRLNKKASPGPDNMSGMLLWAGERELKPLLKIFFNKLFSHAKQPNMFTLNFLISI